MKIMRIKTIYCKPRTTVIDPANYKYPYLLRGLQIESSNQVWQIDISYIPLAKGFMYLVAIIDVHSRFIVGWDISNTMTANWRSEERRVGKECRSRWSPEHLKETERRCPKSSEESAEKASI